MGDALLVNAVFTVRTKGIRLPFYFFQQYVMFLPQDGFDGGFRFRNVLYDEGIVIQYVTGGIIQPGVPKEQSANKKSSRNL